MGKEKDIEPEVFIQYRHYETLMDEVIERIKEHYFIKNVDPIKAMQVYIKPEESTAYYVINDSVAGKVGLF